MNKGDGMSYAPKGIPNPVVIKGEFIFAATALDHGHINGMTNGLIEAGATLKWVYDPDQKKVDDYIKQYPEAKQAESLAQILEDPEVQMVAAAAIPSLRADLGIKVMEAGKHYFTDKTPLTTLDQLERAKKAVEETGKRYFVYYSERLHVEAAVYAGELIEKGVIGEVVQTLGMGPHRLREESRPDWFFEFDKYGGILCDIGSHQIEQFLFYTGATDAKVVNSKVANYDNPRHPELEDFGDATLVGNNGASGYFRVDWFTPDGLSTWGDGRMFILGTEGYIELRKYVNVAEEEGGGHVFWADKEGEHYFNATGKVGYPFFGEMILDCINGTEKAMTQEHIFKAAELCVRAQVQAERLTD